MWLYLMIKTDRNGMVVEAPPWFSDCRGLSLFPDAINNLGEMRWELVNFIKENGDGRYIYVFKRPR